MRTDFKSVIQILDYYNDNAKCIALLEQQRWNGKPVCPHCGYSEKIYRTDRGFRCASKECGKKFSVTVGTIYENSKIPLRYWFAGVYLITAHKKGISSHQLARDLGVTQKTAWFILHRVREMLKGQAPDLLVNEVQVDETFVGGKDKNKHGTKTARTPSKALISSGNAKGDDKTPVVGAIETGGKVKARKVENTKAVTLKAFILENIDPNATMVTDEFTSYSGLSKAGYKHEKVNHKSGQYVRAGFHTNGIENFWSQFKRGIIGIYHQVSVKHLDRYCDEFTYRYNTRKLTDSDRFIGVLKHSEGRLKWADLVAKDEDLEAYMQSRKASRVSHTPRMTINDTNGFFHYRPESC